MKRFFQASLPFKLALAFALALLPILFVTLWGFRTDVRDSQKNVLDYQMLAAEAVATQVEETFDAALAVAWAVANDPLVQTLDAQRLDSHLRNLTGYHPIFAGISVWDTNGMNRGWGSSRTPAEPRLNISDRSYFKTVIGTNGPTISEVIQLKPESIQGIIAAVPIRNRVEQVIGVVTVGMTTAQLSKWYEEGRLRPGQAVLLIDRAGQLAFHSAERYPKVDQLGAYQDLPPVRRALSGTPQTVAKFQSPIGGDERIGAFVPTRRYHWAVGVSTPRDIALEPVHAGLKRQLLGVLGTLLLSGVLATLMARQLTSPLSRLRAYAHAIGQGKLSQRVSVKTGDEFEDLGDAFNQMVEQIQTRDAHLRASEERFRATFEQAAVGIAHTATDGTWLWVNDRLCEILGYSREELIERNMQEITHPDDQPRDVALVQELLSGRFAKYAMEKRCRRKDGSFIWVNTTVTLARDADGAPAYFIAVVEDIQRRKQMEEDRRGLLQREQSARASAEAASRAKDQLLATVSHELRTPLTPVLAALDLLEEDEAFSERSRACLRMIRGNIETEARLVGDLLDLTRIRQAKLSLRREKTDIHEVLRLVLNCFEHETNAKNLQLSSEFLAQEPLVLGDSTRLQQVFWNLLSNAVKYTPDGGRITVRTANEPGLVKVAVEDTGIGITPDVMERLFNAFEQGEQTLIRRYSGLGLGLAISKSLVDMHGGVLTASSDGAGKGAVFTVKLPLAGAQDADTTSPEVVCSLPGRGCRILLVEDNPDTQSVLAKLLQRSGHLVTTASSVRESLEIAQSKEFDVLVSDIGLPDASGWQLMRELSKTHQLKAIAISGFGTPEDQEKSREAGFLHHLVKPINYQMLRELIGQMCATGPVKPGCQVPEVAQTGN